MPVANIASINNEFDAVFDCFVISLKRTPERLQAFHEHNAKSGIVFQHFEAVDGTQVNIPDIEGRIIATGITNYTRGIIGHAMSQLALWQRCANQKKGFVIFEDDAVIRNDFKARFISLARQSNDWDIILLGYNTDVPLELFIAPGIVYGGGFSVPYPTIKHLFEFANSTNPVSLHRINVAMGTCGLAVTPKGAQILIQNCFPMDNRTVQYDSRNYAFRAHSLDSMLATIYAKISAFACVAPLVMTANDKNASTTKR